MAVAPCAAMRALVLLCLLAAPALADVDRTAVRGQVAAAIAKRDIATVTQLAKLPLRIDRLWFDTPRCKEFRTRREVTAEQLPKLVDCFAGLGIEGDDRMTYGPGVPLLMMIDRDGKLRAIISIRIEGIADDAAVIHPDIFAKHAAGFSREVVPDAPLKAQVDRDGNGVRAMVRVCVDKRGKIDEVDVTQAENEAYGPMVDKAVRRWKVKPFAARGKALRACSSLVVGYPEDSVGTLAFLPPPPPPPPPSSTDPTTPPANGAAPQNIPPTLLEGQRISGNKAIVPDDVTKVAIARKKATRLIGSWKLCVSDTGVVKSVKKLKATGFDDYDAKIEREMWKWVYRPYLVNGKPANVCTAVTFIYTQEAPPERGK